MCDRLKPVLLLFGTPVAEVGQASACQWHVLKPVLPGEGEEGDRVRRQGELEGVAGKRDREIVDELRVVLQKRMSVEIVMPQEHRIAGPSREPGEPEVGGHVSLPRSIDDHHEEPTRVG